MSASTVSTTTEGRITLPAIPLPETTAESALLDRFTQAAAPNGVSMTSAFWEPLARLARDLTENGTARSVELPTPRTDADRDAWRALGEAARNDAASTPVGHALNTIAVRAFAAYHGVSLDAYLTAETAATSFTDLAEFTAGTLAPRLRCALLAHDDEAVAALPQAMSEFRELVRDVGNVLGEACDELDIPGGSR